MILQRMYCMYLKVIFQLQFFQVNVLYSCKISTDEHVTQSLCNSKASCLNDRRDSSSGECVPRGYADVLLTVTMWRMMCVVWIYAHPAIFFRHTRRPVDRDTSMVEFTRCLAFSQTGGTLMKYAMML